jgi:hypothetical protein
LPFWLNQRCWLAALLACRQADLEQYRCRSCVRGSGSKNSLQQRHLRRFGEGIIVRRNCEKPGGEENEKEDPEENPARRRKKKFRAKWRKKTTRKKTELQTAAFSPIFIPPLTDRG